MQSPGSKNIVYFYRANLTDYAFTINMELGVLATSGSLAEQIEKHFERRIDTGVLISV
jgi:hypothetical protein